MGKTLGSRMLKRSQSGWEWTKRASMVRPDAFGSFFAADVTSRVQT